jgi:hypothetical protein
LITEYELYADERETKSRSGHYFWLGGVVCTDKGRSRLLDGLSKVRSRYARSGEMKWGKVSDYADTLDVYRAWVDIFFEDPFARYSLLQIDVSSQDWSSFRPRPGRRRYHDDRLASAYHQFLLVTFSPLRDTKRWSVYPDAGLFSRPDKVLDRVEFLFNRTYKLAFGPKSSRIIRLARERDSANTDLIQLADVLLGAFTFHILDERPQNRARVQLVDHCVARLSASPTTRQGPPRLSFNRWVLPERFAYSS